MELRYYLNGQRIYPLVSPTITNTQDETLDSGTLVLQTSTIEKPIAPMQLVKVEWWEGGSIKKTELYYTISDNVSVFSAKPLQYQHQLSIVQNTRKLTKHLCRNSVFTQPINDVLKGYNAKQYLLAFYPSLSAGYTFNEPKDEGWVEPIEIKSFSIVDKAYIDIHCWKIYKSIANDKMMSFKDQKIDYKTIIKLQKLNNDIWEDVDSWTYNDGLQTPAHIDLTNDIEALQQGGIYRAIVNITYTAPFSSSDIQALNPDVKVGAKWWDFSFVIHVDLTIKHHYYSMYEILQELRNQYQQRTQLSLNGKREALYEMPNKTSEFGKLLDKTIAPNFTFTQMNYYEVLAECFKVFDGVMTIDENNVLGIEYFNEDNNAQKIDTLNKTGMQKTIQEDRYNNGVIAQYQRARNYIEFPKKNYLRASSTILGVPEQQSWEMRTDHPIEMISTLNIFINKMTIPTTYTIADGQADKNITSFAEIEFNDDISLISHIVEESVWRTLSPKYYTPSGDGLFGNYNPMDMTQVNHLYYTKGTKGIPCGAYYQNVYNQEISVLQQVIDDAIYRWLGWNDLQRKNSDTNKWLGHHATDITVYNLQFHVDYNAMLNGRLQIESLKNKYNGEFLGNQASGGVDLNKLGVNLLGTINKLGEESFSVSLPIASDYNNVIQKGAIYIDDNGERWIANNVNFSIFNSHITEQVEFVKNFNMIAQRIALDQEKRFTEISRDLVVMSEDNLIDYIYFSNKPILDTEYTKDKTTLHLYNSTIKTMFANVFNKETTTYNVIDYAVVNTCFMPLHKYTSANNVCFELSFDDPISAGNSFKQGGLYGEGSWFAVPIIYTTDERGYMQNIDIKFKQDTTTYKFTNEFPKISVDKLAVDLDAGEIYLTDFYKRPNEILALNYQLCFLPYSLVSDTRQKEFIGASFFECGGLLGQRNIETQFYLYKSDTETYSTRDKYGKGTKSTNAVPISIIDLSDVDADGNHLETQIAYQIQIQGEINTRKSWALCDSFGRIYFASNQALARKKPSIYIAGSIRRK